ncbi:MAG: hypothetical protein IKS84_06105, partial [Lachnospiraceae bacterium]|nr:hypothetical protein [Lachnospiraceae bacterium]
FEPATAKFDYICECVPYDNDIKVSFTLNGDDADWADWDFQDADDRPAVRAKRGCFTGTLTSFTKE